MRPSSSWPSLAAVLAGCGGGGGRGGGGGGGTTGHEPTGGGGVNGISVGNCLNDDENFLVQPSGDALDGQSPAGVVFTLTFYKDDAAAEGRRREEEQEDDRGRRERRRRLPGNPSIYAGAPPAKISQVELAAIKRCIDKAK